MRLAAQPSAFWRSRMSRPKGHYRPIISLFVTSTALVPADCARALSSASVA